MSRKCRGLLGWLFGHKFHHTTSEWVEFPLLPTLRDAQRRLGPPTPGGHMSDEPQGQHSEEAAEKRGIWYRWHSGSDVGSKPGFRHGGKSVAQPQEDT